MSRINLGAVTAYAIAKENGFEGTEKEWLESLVGNGFEGKLNEYADKLEKIESIAKGAQQAISFDSYETMINAFNNMPIDKYNSGQSVYIVTLSVPDLWISYITDTNVPYTYDTDQAFVDELQASGSVQVGNYKFSQLEQGKVIPDDYVKKTDYATNEKFGLVRLFQTDQHTGLAFREDFGGALVVAPATETYINLRDGAAPITPKNLDYAAMSALANCMKPELWTDDTTDENGETVKGTKTKACETLGALKIPEFTGLAVDSIIGYQNGEWKIFKIDASDGLALYAANNRLGINPATKAQIDDRTAYERKALCVALLDYAIKVGLTTNTETLTDEEKAAALAWLGATRLYSHYIADKNNIAFRCELINTNPTVTVNEFMSAYVSFGTNMIARKFYNTTTGYNVLSVTRTNLYTFTVYYVSNGSIVSADMDITEQTIATKAL